MLIACVWMNFWRHPTSKCKADGPWFGSLRYHQKLKNLSGEFAGIVFLRALDCEIKEWTARLFVLCATRIRKTICISYFIAQATKIFGVRGMLFLWFVIYSIKTMLQVILYFKFFRFCQVKMLLCFVVLFWAFGSKETTRYGVRWLMCRDLFFIAQKLC